MAQSPDPAHHQPASVESHAHSDAAHDVSKHVRGYLFVGACLFACTALTVGLSYVHFGTETANIVVAMIVAAVKAGLVAAIFMHLLSEKWTIYRILIVTTVFVLGLFLLTFLAFHDPIRLH